MRVVLAASFFIFFPNNPDDREIKESLVRLKSTDPEVRIASARFLGEKKIKGAVPLLLKSLSDDEEWAVRSWVAWALGEIDHKSAIDPIIVALEKSEKILSMDSESREGGAIVQYNVALRKL